MTLSYVALVRLRVNYLDGDNALLARTILEEALRHPENRAPPDERHLVRDSGVSVAPSYRAGDLVWSAGVFTAPQHHDPHGLEHPDPAPSVGIGRVYTAKEGQVAHKPSALRAYLIIPISMP